MQKISLLLLSCFLVTMSLADDYEPEVVRASDFKALRDNSPFNRTLNLNGSLIITGIAKIDDQQVATLLDTKSKQSHVVSGIPNQQGWKMVEVNPNKDLQMVTAKISLGGEVVSIRYGENKLKPGEARPAGGSPKVEERDSKPQARKGPSEDLRKKMHSLSNEQKGKFFTKMKELNEKHPGMSQEDRTNMSRKVLEKMAKKDK